MESIIRDVLVTHVENNSLITKHQHGFMTGRSCLTHLLETFESWTRILDAAWFWNRHYVSGLLKSFWYCAS